MHTYIKFGGGLISVVSLFTNVLKIQLNDVVGLTELGKKQIWFSVCCLKSDE